MPIAYRITESVLGEDFVVSNKLCIACKKNNKTKHCKFTFVFK